MTERVRKMLEEKLVAIEQQIVVAQLRISGLESEILLAKEHYETAISIRNDIMQDLAQ